MFTAMERNEYAILEEIKVEARDADRRCAQIFKEIKKLRDEYNEISAGTELDEYRQIHIATYYKKKHVDTMLKQSVFTICGDPSVEITQRNALQVIDADNRRMVFATKLDQRDRNYLTTIYSRNRDGPRCSGYAANAESSVWFALTNLLRSRCTSITRVIAKIDPKETAAYSRRILQQDQMLLEENTPLLEDSDDWDTTVTHVNVNKHI